MTWQEAIQHRFHAVLSPRKDTVSYSDGYKDGWFDAFLRYNSTVARNSTIPYYSLGYDDGWTDYFRYHNLTSYQE